MHTASSAPAKQAQAAGQAAGQAGRQAHLVLEVLSSWLGCIRLQRCGVLITLGQADVGAAVSDQHKHHAPHVATLLRLDGCAHRQRQAVGQWRAATAGQLVQAAAGHGDGLGGGQQHLCLVAVEGDQAHLQGAGRRSHALP